MNAEVADILCGNKRLADYFESFGVSLEGDDMNTVANILANDVLRELNYRDINFSDLPIEYTFMIRYYLIRRVKEGNRSQFVQSLRGILNMYAGANARCPGGEANG